MNVGVDRGIVGYGTTAAVVEQLDAGMVQAKVEGMSSQYHTAHRNLESIIPDLQPRSKNLCVLSVIPICQNNNQINPPFFYSSCQAQEWLWELFP